MADQKIGERRLQEQQIDAFEGPSAELALMLPVPLGEIEQAEAAFPHQIAHRFELEDRAGREFRKSGVVAEMGVDQRVTLGGCVEIADRNVVQDRKSTRLNSSH